MNMIAQAYLHNLMGQCIDEFPCTGLNVKGLNQYADSIKESEVDQLHQEFGIIKNGIAQIMELNRHQLERQGLEDVQKIARAKNKYI